jgi:class 3 adenylate cyclase
MVGEIHTVGGAKLARISWYSTRRPARRQSHAFPAGAVVAIGRSVDQQIMLDDESVSRSHARLEIGHGTVLFKDLGSSNGSFLDGAQKVEQVEWQPGQRIHIAAYILELEFVADDTLIGRATLPEPDRVLVTVMFTDIVGSTERAVELGDRHWHELLERYLDLARRQLDQFHGCEIDVAGDGLFATFDGPTRAIRCACTIRDAVHQLGLEVRAGLHTGECEVREAKVSGIVVHTGARVAAAARPQEVLMSETVKGLVAGSGIQFEDRGTHVLKGVPGEWRLFAVTLA